MCYNLWQALEQDIAYIHKVLLRAFKHIMDLLMMLLYIV